MKRFHSLSTLALMATLAHLAHASTALAAPEPKSVGDASPRDASKVVRVAQVEANGQTPVKDQPTSPEPQNPLEVGGSLAPVQDTAAQSAEGTTGKANKRPWANSAIYAVTSMTTGTVFRGQTQYANPTVDSQLWFVPRYAINDAFQLRARLVFNYEYTNSDTTVTKNEPRFSDTTLQLFYRKIPEVLTVKPQVYVQLTAPTSPESRARTMVVSPGVGGNLSRTFEHVLGGELQVVGLLSYSHPIYSSANPEIRGNRPYPVQCGSGRSGCADLLSGTLNPSDTLSYAATVSATWGKFAPAVYYLGASQFVYHPTNTTVPIAPGQNVEVASAVNTRSSVRQTHYFSLWLDYEVNTWLTPEIGYSMSRSALNEGGNYGNPFFDRYQDTRVYLGANFNIDALVEKITTGGEAEAGIVRTKNDRKKQPVMGF